MRNLFVFSSAVGYLKSRVEESSGTYRYKSSLAEAAGCQLSYLSQILSGKALLSLDQAVGLAELWQLSSLETDYFLELVQLERAGTPKLKNILKRRITEIKKEGERLTSRITQLENQIVPDSSYYLTWYYTAIHILLTIPSFDSEAPIGKRLGISIEKVRQGLEILEKLGFAQLQKGRWRNVKSNVHIPRESPLHELNHFHWRNQSVSAVQNRRDALSYTGIHSLSRKHLDEIKELAARFLAKARHIIETSPEEELICLNCDLFLV